MTQEADNYAFPNSTAGEVAQCVERLIQDTNEDLRNFRAEQSQLRAQISNVLGENRQLTNELGKYKHMMSSGSLEDVQERLQLTSDALSKALLQIESLRKDRRSLQSMHERSRRTIDHMETELNNYRTQLHLDNGEQLAQKYGKAIKTLEAKLTAQQEELRTQAELIKALHDHKQRSGEQILHLQTKLKERFYNKVAADENQDKMEGLQKQLRDYEKSLQYTRTLLDESSKREALAMRKVQDALNLSEAAVQEKAEAEKRSEAYKEEATQLATNIGSIMDEAAKRVDNEVAQLKIKLAEKDKTITALREKLKEESVQQKSMVQALETRNDRLAEKYKEALKQNEKLEAHMEACSKRLNDLERCAYNEIRKDEENQLKSKKEYEEQMENYLQAYKQLKAHYKDVVSDLTQKFESEFIRLEKEKAEILTEYELYKNGACGDYAAK
ncbi:myosin-11 isoform X2 [Drosophila busckii]|uniref:myosin-11 isoform X2 n=1 Tax=Drosophila busckii TaxID=30019 RepID=UPI00083E963A|nr:myosin-11 isoform X2 [Drosophila busckii]